MSDLVLVIPCYNEAQRLPRDTFSRFMESNDRCSFLFVDDGSTDRTINVLRDLQQLFPAKVKVLQLQHNQGKAEAVRRGMLDALESPAAFLGYWDADLATPLETISHFLEVFDSKPLVEMVFGARIKLMGHDVQRKLYRHYLGRIFATCASGVLGLSIYDTQCGAKIFRRTDYLRKLFEERFQSRWIFDVELLARFMSLNKSAARDELEARIFELPLPVWRDISGSKVKPTDFFRALGELIHIYFSYR